MLLKPPIAFCSSSSSCQMEAATPSALSKPTIFQPDTDNIVRKLQRRGVHPTPKIIHNLLKKAIQKHNRWMAKEKDLSGEAKDGASDEYSEYMALREEYREFNRAWKAKRSDFDGDPRSDMVGFPWEGIDRVRMREALDCGGVGEEGSGVLGKVGRRPGLRELGEMIEDRRREELRWLLDDDDLELDEEEKEGLSSVEKYGLDWIDGMRSKRIRTEDENVKFLVAREFCSS